jgi:hypothetical protein
MRRPARSVMFLGGSLALTASVLAQTTGEVESFGGGPEIMPQQFSLIELPDGGTFGAYEQVGRIRRLFGGAMATGATPKASADAFVEQNAAMFGVERADLRPIGPFPDGHHQQPIMYDAATDSFRFTGVYYAQYWDDIPVFRSRMMVLTRNEPDHPAVLASTDLHNLGGFDPDMQPGAMIADAGIDAALQAHPDLINFTQPELVVWAGLDDLIVEPKLAYTFVGDNGMQGTVVLQRFLFVADASTGAILYEENQILDVDVEGNVSARISPDHRADACTLEEVLPMQYARVSIGGTHAYADVNGDFVIPNGGSDEVTVNSQIRGRWFTVDNTAGPESFIDLNVVPPGPAIILHNSLPTEFTTAEVNSYHEANIVRDEALFANPMYPTIWNQEEFPINVNLNDDCNAFYDYSSINFFRALGGCNNTGFGDVVHHEYGHHLVQVGGSGQGEYGEGMGDVMGMLITLRHELGVGFRFCNEGIRDADNTMQYPCSGEIHFCGQLISGCVWDLLEELMLTEPVTFREITRDLAVNSIMLHTGSGIAPDITVDYLTLDDDDESIFNGTPHYEEIATAFGLHNMDAPELAALFFTFPDGFPDTLDPSGGTTVRVVVEANVDDPEPNTGMLYYDDGDGWQAVPMNEVEPNVYDAVFPAIECGSLVTYYFSAETTGGETETWPLGAPDESFEATSAFDLIQAFEDDFETDQGWSVSGNATDGQWQRGVPAGGGDRGDPPNDADGSGSCYVTDNVDGDNDIDNGTTILTSPIMDASAGNMLISYYRWYSNTFGNAPMADIFVVEVSDDGGSSWTELETVGPGGPEVDGGWFFKTFLVDDVVEPTDQFRIRFVASDLGEGSVVEAGVDGVELIGIDCESLPEDINGDGVINVLDLLSLLDAWGPCVGCPEDINGDGTVDITDLLLLLAAWS